MDTFEEELLKAIQETKEFRERLHRLMTKRAVTQDVATCFRAAMTHAAIVTERLEQARAYLFK